MREAQKPGQKVINVIFDDSAGGANYRSPQQRAINRTSIQEDGSVRIPAYADGKLPNQAVIQSADPRGGLIQWAEPSTDGEGFVPLALSKRRRSTEILGEIARRFGYGLIPMGGAGIGGGRLKLLRMADGAVTSYGLPAGSTGGFPDWVTQLGSEYGVTPSTYAGHQETDRGEAGYAANPQHLNRGIDWSGSVDQMQAFAEAMVAQAASDPSIEQVIFMNPNTGQKIGWHGGQPDTDGSYFANDYPQHTGHVHTRFSAQLGQMAQAAGGIKDVTLSNSSSREDVARKIIAEGRKRGYSDAEIEAFLATAIQESNLEPDAYNQQGDWKGTFQQDSSYAGRDDPNSQVTGFYDRMDEKKKSGGWSQDDPYANAFWLQQRPGDSSAQAAVSNGRSGYMDEIKSRQGEASSLMQSLGPSVGTMGDTGGAPAGVQQVYVVNMPGSGLSSGTSIPAEASGSDNSGDVSTSSSEVSKSDDEVAKAKQRRAEATTGVADAERRLSEVRANPRSQPSEIAAAENALTKAHNNERTATQDVLAAEMKLSEQRAKTTNQTGVIDKNGNFVKDPNTLDFTITNPYGVWWWAGEKEQRDALIREYEERNQYREATQGDDSKGSTSSDKAGSKDKLATGSQLTASANDIAEAKRKISEAEADVRVKQIALDEAKNAKNPKQSTIAARDLALTKAQNTLTKARENLVLLEQKQNELQNRGVVKMWTGGTVPGVGSGDIVPLMAEPGEEVTRRAMAIKHRALLKAINADKVQRLAAGGTTGFGGYADDNSDYMKPTSLQDWVHLGIGGASMVASGIAPLISMAASGKVDLGSALPSFSTDGNDPSGGLASTVVSDFASQISQQLADLIRAVKEGKDIHVTVDNGSGAADMVGMAARV